MATKTPEEMAEEYCEDHDECEHARNAFLAGYQAAKDQLADADKVIPKWNSVDAVGDSIDRSAIQHALAVLKKKPFPQWISVKHRLPSCGVLCAWIVDTTQSCIARIEVDDMHPWYEGFDYWCELPEPPKEEE